MYNVRIILYVNRNISLSQIRRHVTDCVLDWNDCTAKTIIMLDSTWFTWEGKFNGIPSSGSRFSCLEQQNKIRHKHLKVVEIIEKYPSDRSFLRVSHYNRATTQLSVYLWLSLSLNKIYRILMYVDKFSAWYVGNVSSVIFMDLVVMSSVSTLLTLCIAIMCQ